MNKKKIILMLAAAMAIQTGCTKIPAESVPSAAMVYKEESSQVTTAAYSETVSVSQLDTIPTETAAAAEIPAAEVTEETTAETTVTTAEATETETEAETKEDTEEIPEENETSDDISVHVEEIKLSMYDVEVYISKSKMPIVKMSPYNADSKAEIWTSSDSSVATVDAKGNITGVSEGKCTVKVASETDPDVFAEVNVTVKPLPDAGEAYTEDGITYVDGILVVNKTYSLPTDYAPGVNNEAVESFNKMQWDAMANDKVTIYISSDYRSYEYQEKLYNRYVAQDGAEEADKYSARPGYSEHQTGLAFDLNSIDISFANTKAGQWVAEHCYEYGFIIRYPKGKEDITGFSYEPWHIRYLGEENAKKVHDSGLTLEEYLGITSEYAD